MKRKITLLFMLIACFFTTQAQEWIYYKDFPVNVNPRFVVSNNLGTIFMCASDNTLYYKLLNGSWTMMVSSYQMLYPINPISISIDQNSNRMYVGDQFNSGLLYTSNFGASWQHFYFATDPNSGFHEQISDLSNIRTPNLFFGITDALNPTIIKYTNYGQNAQFITYYFSDDPDYSADKLYFTSNQKLLIGTYGKGIWVGTNNGTSIAQSGFNQNHIIDFAEGANGRVYALGINESQGNNFMIYSDDYINWEYMNLPTGNERFRTIYYDGFLQNLWLGSDRAIYKLNVSGSADTGWTGASLNNGVQSEIEILGDNQGGIYNFSDQKIAQKLNSDENEWVDINSGLTGTVNKVLFGTNDRIYASSYMSKNISIAASQSAAWNNIFVSNETLGIQSMHLTNQGVLYANTGKKIKKSVDNGLNFTDVTPPFVSNYIASFYVGEAGDFFMVNSDEQDKLYVSHNQGETWSFLHQFPSISSFSPDLIKSVAQDSNGVIYVTMQTLETFFGVYKVYYSTNSGVTWNTKIVQQLDLVGFDVEVFAKNNNVFVLLGGRVHKYIYNAQNDLTAVNPPPGFTNLSHIWLDNQGNYYTYDFGLYKSSDEGSNWTFLGSPASVSAVIVDDILFDSNNKPYIVVTQADQPSQIGIYYVNEILSSERPQYENDLIIFPVPAHNEITLSTSFQIEKIAVYDMLGKKIIEYNNPQNTIDISCISQGQYILKIQNSDSKIVTSKFVKK